jgi:hypothetical protein
MTYVTFARRISTAPSRAHVVIVDLWAWGRGMTAEAHYSRALEDMRYGDELV